MEVKNGIKLLFLRYILSSAIGRLRQEKAFAKERIRLNQLTLLGGATVCTNAEPRLLAHDVR